MYFKIFKDIFEDVLKDKRVYNIDLDSRNESHKFLQLMSDKQFSY